MTELWKLDPYRDAYAKRLARYLRSEWRMNTQKYLRAKGAPPQRYRTWANVLDDAGIDAQSEVAQRRPAKLREDVTRALNKLYDLEVIRDCSTTELYHPDDLRLLDALPRKGFLSAFLQLRVCIDPAEDMAEALAESDAKRRARAERQRALPPGQTKTTRKRH
jgi:hypothetical protein